MILKHPVCEVDAEEVARYVLHTVVLRDILSAHTNDDSKLDFVVDIFVVGVPFEGFSWYQSTVKGLVEPHWLGGLLVVELLDVSVVVPANTDDLAS